jgi:putative hemolysin
MKIKRKEELRVVKVEHNKKLLWVIGFLVLVLIIVVIVLRQEITKRDALILNDTQIANPASVFCTSQGGKLELVNNESGSYGLCTLASGVVCEEWALFRGECNGLSGALVAEDFCAEDTDCVPASCCHPTSCVNKNSAPNCSRLMCTMSCELGTLDCGQGSCVCQNNKCGVKLIEEL